MKALKILTNQWTPIISAIALMFFGAISDYATVLCGVGVVWMVFLGAITLFNKQ